MTDPAVWLHTDMGTMQIRLLPELAPRTVENFLKLAEAGFYDGLQFHRVIPDRFIQTGCPRGSGLGGPGYFIEDEFSAELNHRKPGSVSMANFGPGTSGSQFFIAVTPMPWLDHQHNCFGRLCAGLDVAMAISRVHRDIKDRPMEPVRLHAIQMDSASIRLGGAS